MNKNTWSLRVWQRSLGDYFVVATLGGSDETEFFITDGKDDFRIVRSDEPCPDLRGLRARPTNTISPVVRAAIRGCLARRHWVYEAMESAGLQSPYIHVGVID